MNQLIGTDLPLVSIIIPVYNAEKYLEAALNSVITQSYAKWECILVDDGSSDRSAEICQRFCFSDPRFIYLSQSNSGPSKARNEGMLRSSGEFVQFLDADDVILPDRLKTMVRLSMSVPVGTILYSDMVIGKNNDIYQTSDPAWQRNSGVPLDFHRLYSDFGRKVLFIPSCILFPREVLKEARWDQSIRNSEDWDYYLQVTSRGCVLEYVDEKLTIYRNTSDSLSKNTGNNIAACYYILNKWHRKGLWSVRTVRISELMVKNLLLFARKKLSHVSFRFVDDKQGRAGRIAMIICVFFLSCCLLAKEMIAVAYKRIR